MDYPSSFSQVARDRVETARILALRSLDKKSSKASWDSERQALLRDCILDVFLVFAEEACSLPDGLDQVRRKSEEFLRVLTIEILGQRNQNSRHWISNWDGSLLRDIDQAFRRSAQWTKYEDTLLSRGKRSTTTTSIARPSSRRPRVDAYIQEVLEKTNTKIYRKDIWCSAGYKTRSEFEKWERNDSNKKNKTAAARFEKILADKPHLKHQSK